ncbi:MAG: oligosaccharide flippase family protein [Muribaculaceae bacterium]
MKRSGGGVALSRTIIKAMSLFGGVQILSILCAVIRTKLIAIWIGPAGIGLFGLYNSAIEMISSFSELGIRKSSVRDIAIGTSNRAIIIKVVRRWSWFVGLLGAVLTLSFAPLLSKLTFGDDTHIWGFVSISIVLLINALALGEQAILQGTSKLRRLAQASLCGVTSGVIVSIPLFYIWRIDSVIPAIIAYSAMTALFMWLFRNKDYRQKTPLNAKETFNIGKGFVRLGIFMTLSNFITVLFSYIFMAYLNRETSITEVGYYQAGYTLVNKYAGLIFTAIGMEYYPRLAKVSFSNIRLKLFVTQEIVITLLVLTPIITLFLVFRNIIVSLLYAPEFITIVPFISWAILGMIFRGVSWCIAFVILAKGSGKLFLITESISAVTGFVLNVIFYQLWGLTGLGISFVVWYIIYTIVILIVYYRIYHLSLNISAFKILFVSIIISAATFASLELGSLIIAIILSICTVGISAIILRKMLN